MEFRALSKCVIVSRDTPTLAAAAYCVFIRRKWMPTLPVSKYPVHDAG
jgi:hypothetical protein